MIDGTPASTAGTSADIPQPALDITVNVEPALVDITTACAMLGGISRRALDGFVTRGAITPKRVGSRVLFQPDEIRRFAASCPDWEPFR